MAKETKIAELEERFKLETERIIIRNEYLEEMIKDLQMKIDEQALKIAEYRTESQEFREEAQRLRHENVRIVTLQEKKARDEMDVLIDDLLASKKNK